jgi:hypothetical protein
MLTVERMLIAGGVLLALLAGAFWAGMEWEQGRAAEAAVEARDEALADLRDQYTADVQSIRDAAAALGTISQEYANARETTRRFFAQLGRPTPEQRRAHPQLDACDIGPFWLQQWNRANRGPAAEPAPGSADGAEGAVLGFTRG